MLIYSYQNAWKKKSISYILALDSLLSKHFLFAHL